MYSMSWTNVLLLIREFSPKLHGFCIFSLSVTLLGGNYKESKKSNEVAMGGGRGRGAQQPVLLVSERKKTGARNTRVLYHCL
jgi:hypothetical protein